MTRLLATWMRLHRVAVQRGDEVARIQLHQRIRRAARDNRMAFCHAYRTVYGHSFTDVGL